MNRLSPEEQISQLQAALIRQKKENKNLRPQVKYIKESKSKLKDEKEQMLLWQCIR